MSTETAIVLFAAIGAFGLGMVAVGQALDRLHGELRDLRNDLLITLADDAADLHAHIDHIAPPACTTDPHK